MSRTEEGVDRLRRLSYLAGRCYQRMRNRDARPHSWRVNFMRWSSLERALWKERDAVLYGKPSHV